MPNSNKTESFWYASFLLVTFVSIVWKLGLEAFNRVAGGRWEGKSHEMFPIFAEEIPDTRKFSSRCVLKTKVFIAFVIIFDVYNQNENHPTL